MKLEYFTPLKSLSGSTFSTNAVWSCTTNALPSGVHEITSLYLPQESTLINCVEDDQDCNLYRVNYVQLNEIKKCQLNITRVGRQKVLMRTTFFKYFDQIKWRLLLPSQGNGMMSSSMNFHA